MCDEATQARLDLLAERVQKLEKEELATLLLQACSINGGWVERLTWFERRLAPARRAGEKGGSRE